MAKPNTEQRCPVCGRGVFTNVVHEDPDADGPQTRLDSDSREILMFSCGHEVRGASLETADPDRLTVERRESDETAQPVDDEARQAGRKEDDDAR